MHVSNCHHLGGVTGLWWVETRDTALHALPDGPTTEYDPASNVSEAESENLREMRRGATTSQDALKESAGSPQHPLLPKGSMSWISCRGLSGGIEGLLEDLALCAPHMDCPEVSLLREALQLCRPAVELRGMGEWC